MKGFTVIHENDDFLAVNKEPGMLTIPDRFNSYLPSLYSSLSRQYEKIYVVHRLDKETSGLLLFAKNEDSHKYLSQLFEHRKVQKHYLAFVMGSMPQGEGEIQEPIAEHPYKKGMMVVNKKGKPSLTRYIVRENFQLYSLVDFEIATGRTHQIRVHAGFIGHPILGDATYGQGDPVFLSGFKKKYRLSANQEKELPILERMALHSHTLEFTGAQGQPYRMEAPLPKDMRALLQQLKKNIR